MIAFGENTKDLLARLTFVFALFSLSCQQAQASWADVPMEQLLEKADLVVAGEITRLDKEITVKIGDHERRLAVGVITVKETLKGPSQKEVRLVWPQATPAGGGLVIMSSTDLTYQKGQAGVWILTKDKKENYYWADYPKDFQKDSERDKIVEMIRAASKAEQGNAKEK